MIAIVLIAAMIAVGTWTELMVRRKIDTVDYVLGMVALTSGTGVLVIQVMS